MKKTLCKLLCAAAALALTAAAALPIGKIGRVEAATKRTAVVSKPSDGTGKINTAVGTPWEILPKFRSPTTERCSRYRARPGPAIGSPPIIRCPQGKAIGWNSTF